MLCLPEPKGWSVSKNTEEHTYGYSGGFCNLAENWTKSMLHFTMVSPLILKNDSEFSTRKMSIKTTIRSYLMPT